MGADGWAWHSAYSTPTQCAYGLKRFAGSPRLVADLGNAIARGVAVEHRDVNGTRWLALADTSPRYVEIAAVAL
jgi:hypothetical protein